MIPFALNPQSGVPIYRQIQDQIRYGIASGKLTPGEQLPTVRALAVELSVNPNTVIKAYTELERLGILTTEQGSGTFVAPQPALSLSERDRHAKLHSLCVEFLSHAGRYGFGPDEVVEAIRKLQAEESTHEPDRGTRAGNRRRQTRAGTTGETTPAPDPGGHSPPG